MNNMLQIHWRMSQNEVMWQGMAPKHVAVAAQVLRGDPFPLGKPSAQGATPLPLGQTLCPKDTPRDPKVKGPGAKDQGPWTRASDKGAGTWDKGPVTRDLGPGDQGLRDQGAGTRARDQGQGTRDLGLGSGT